MNGWLHTGDVGYFDGDGYLTLVDRIKDLIMRGGENAYPKESSRPSTPTLRCRKPPLWGDPTPCTASAGGIRRAAGRP